MFSVHRNISRATVMNISCLALSTALLAANVMSCKEKQADARQGGRLTIVSYGGGAYRDSQEKAFFDRFSAITGSTIESVVWNADYGKLKTMVNSGRVPWDVVEVTEAQALRAEKEGLLAPLSLTPDATSFAAGTSTPYGVGNIFWATVLTYNNGQYPREKPVTWGDFWDVSRFPGERALYDDPRGNLEIALIADGVTPDQLYPLDVDRALRKLEELRLHVRVWWKDSSQPLQLLSNGTVTLASAWNGRVFSANRTGSDFGMSWSGAALELNWWVIPRGSRHVDLASRFIYFASVPCFLAEQAELVGYGPANQAALKFVSDVVAPSLPTYPDNLAHSFRIDSSWWADNEESLKTRWLQWKNQ